MKKVILFTVFGLFVLLVQGQTAGQFSSSTASADRGLSDAIYKYAVRSITDSGSKTNYYEDRIEGSPYMSNTFLPTTLFYGQEKEGSLFYRYNAYNEEVEIKNDPSEESVKALSKDKKLKIMVAGKPMSFKTYIDKTGRTKNGYLTLLRDGKFKLYKRLNTTFKEGTKSPNSFVKSVPPRFKQSAEYYVEIEGGKSIDFVELKNRKLLGLLETEQQNNLKAYLKDQKIKVNNEKDLTKVIDFLNG